MSLINKKMKLIEIRGYVIHKWINTNCLSEIFEKYDIEPEEFGNFFGIQIYNFLLNVITDFDNAGSCPGMEKLIITLLDKHIEVDDVFMICTTFKNIVVNWFITNDPDIDSITQLQQILDTNLKGVLRLYINIVYKQ